MMLGAKFFRPGGTVVLIPVRQTIEARPDPAASALALSLLVAISGNPMLIARAGDTRATPIPHAPKQPALAAAA